MELTEKQLEEDEERFHKLQMSDQANFNDKLDTLSVRTDGYETRMSSCVIARACRGRRGEGGGVPLSFLKGGRGRIPLPCLGWQGEGLVALSCLGKERG